MDVSRFILVTTCKFQQMMDKKSADHNHISSGEYPICEVGFVRSYYKGCWRHEYFPVHRDLLTPVVVEEVNALYNTVRDKWFPTLNDLRDYCIENAEERLADDEYNFYVMSEEANYWFRFITREDDYNIYMHILKKGVVPDEAESTG